MRPASLFHSSDPVSALPLIDTVERLVAAGQVREAVARVQAALERDDRDAWFLLGTWRLSGSPIPRDLAAAREAFGRAGQLGHPDGRRVYTNFLAQGTGGPRDWPAALALLRERAETEPDAAEEMSLIAAMDLDAAGRPRTLPAPQIRSTRPDVRTFTGFMTATECAFLMRVAEPAMEPALTVHPQTGQLVRHPVRTSDSAAFPLAFETPAIHAINQRIAAVTGTSALQGEPIQVLRYAVGQEYRPHSDALPNDPNQRIATLLVYLNDGYEGGETAFVHTGLSVRGAQGEALFFRNVDAAGRPDPLATHAGLPIRRGSKFIASRWIRARPLDLRG